MIKTMKSSDYYSLTRPEVFRLVGDFKPKRVLEIGSAAGGFRTHFGDVEYWGVEPVRDVAEASRGRLTHVLVGTYAEVADRIPDDYFDLVVCNDVIEHMPDPAAFLVSVSSKVARGGRLVGSVPNVRYLPVMFGYLFLKDWKYNPAGGVLDDTHLRFFTRKSLVRTLRETGSWQVERVRHLTQPVHLLAKFLLALVVWPVGLDVLMGQIGFVARKSSDA